MSYQYPPGSKAWLRMLLTSAVALTLAVGTSASALADPDPGKGEPAPSPVEPAGRGCAEKTQTEFLSCLGVTAALDRAPSVGETATLTVTVRASVKLTPSDIRVELPKQLAWAAVPSGFQASQVASALPERSGVIAVAQRTVALVPGQPNTFTGAVKAVAPGFGEIQARATSPNGTDVDAGQATVFLTVAPTGKASVLGSTGHGTSGTVASIPAPAAVAPRPAGLESRPATLPAAAATGAPTANLACDARVTGTWGYQDEAGTWHTPPNFQVQVRDLARGTMVVGLTDGAGHFDICYDSSVGTQVYITIVAEVFQWRVQNGANVYNWSTGVTNNPGPGSVLNYGFLVPGDPVDYRAAHAFDEGNDAWQFVPKPTNLCFDQKDTTCRQLRINWYRDSTENVHYDLSANEVRLDATAPNAKILVVHEIGHAIMDDVYNDATLAGTTCGAQHFIQNTSSALCAWKEGWAEWFPLTVYHDTFFRWADGSTLDLENASWNNGWGNGDTTEGRVAGALIDITDSTNEQWWDRTGEGFANLWSTFTRHIDNSFASFWANRTIDGFDVSDTGAKAALYQNTVDYGFRDPLADYRPLLRDTPLPHRFGFTTNTIYWSVVAIRPPVGSDYDMNMYNRDETVFFDSSLLGGNNIDFLAIDSNLRPFDSYFPRVHVFRGSGTYSVEVAQGRDILLAGLPRTLRMDNGQFVAVADTFLTAGVPVTISLAPENGGQDPDLFLMASDPSNSATWILSRLFAAAAAATGGAGVTETFTYTPPLSGWYGVVVTEKQGAGNYTLTRT